MDAVIEFAAPGKGAELGHGVRDGFVVEMEKAERLQARRVDDRGVLVEVLPGEMVLNLKYHQGNL